MNNIMSYELLLEKIKNYQAQISVIGLGQVGLPTALTFSKQGYKVFGNDVNKTLISSLVQKKSPFKEEGLNELINQTIDNGKFEPRESLDYVVDKSDIIIVCVATPLDSNNKPDLSFLQNVSKSLSTMNLDGKLVIIECSIPPGTFTNSILPIISKKNKLGENFWAAYVPERLSPSKALSEIKQTPRVIGVEDDKSGTLAKSLYENIVNLPIIITTSKIVELSKLVENSFRDVNIAFANEIALICEHYGIDFTKLANVCNSHPRVDLHMAGPGVGGPCLPKDPFLLLNPSGNIKLNSKIIQESRKVNDLMPLHVSKLVTDTLELQGKKLSESTVLILGAAYKGNVSDARFSPSKHIVHDLQQKLCTVLLYDPHTIETFNAEKIDTLDEFIIQNCDALIIATDHDEFKKLKPSFFKLMKKPPILVDTKRMFNATDVENLDVIYISVGYVKNSDMFDSGGM